MNAEIVGIIGLSLAVLSFYAGRMSDKRKETKEDDAVDTNLKVSDAQLRTDIGYIKESLGRIEGQFGKDIARLDGRMEELSKQLIPLSGLANKAYESSKMVHNRLNEHLRQDHDKKVIDYPDSMGEEPFP